MSIARSLAALAVKSILSSDKPLFDGRLLPRDSPSLTTMAESATSSGREFNFHDDVTRERILSRSDCSCVRARAFTHSLAHDKRAVRFVAIKSRFRWSLWSRSLMQSDHSKFAFFVDTLCENSAMRRIAGVFPFREIPFPRHIRHTSAHARCCVIFSLRLAVHHVAPPLLLNAIV